MVSVLGPGRSWAVFPLWLMDGLTCDDELEDVVPSDSGHVRECVIARFGTMIGKARETQESVRGILAMQ